MIADLTSDGFGVFAGPSDRLGVFAVPSGSTALSQEHTSVLLQDVSSALLQDVSPLLVLAARVEAPLVRSSPL